VRSSSLINPEPGSVSRKSIELYLFGGELECYFSCLGHIFNVWELYVRSNDGALSLSTWAQGTHMYQYIFYHVFSFHLHVLSLFKEKGKAPSSSSSQVSPRKKHLSSPYNKKSSHFRPTRSFEDHIEYFFLSLLIKYIDILLPI